MHQKQIIQFCPDPDTLTILQTVENNERDNYINAALKAYAINGTAKAESASLEAGQSSQGQSSQATAESSPSDRVNAELQRIFEGACDAIKASEAQSSDQVVITEQSTGLTFRCGIADAIDILKSLRQPITTKEVWEILSCLG